MGESVICVSRATPGEEQGERLGVALALLFCWVGFYRKVDELSKVASSIMTSKEVPVPEPELEPEEEQRHRRGPGESWQSFVEYRIQKAQARGEFDNLPGHGKPLPPETVNPYEGDRALAHKILRDHGFAPAWIELDKEVRRELESIRRCLTESRRRYGADSASWRRAVDRLAGQIVELNRKIDLYNLKSPAMQFQRRRIVLTDELRRVEQMEEKNDDG